MHVFPACCPKTGYILNRKKMKKKNRQCGGSMLFLWKFKIPDGWPSREEGR